MDNNTANKLFYGGCIAGTAAYGYGVYRLPKLEGHFNHEGLYVVGALLGGAYATLMGVGFSGMSDSAAPKSVPLEIVGSTLFIGSVSYVICRNLAKKNPKQSLIISTLVGLAGSLANFYQDLGISSYKSYGSNGSGIQTTAPTLPTR